MLAPLVLRLLALADQEFEASNRLEGLDIVIAEALGEVNATPALALEDARGLDLELLEAGLGVIVSSGLVQDGLALLGRRDVGAL